jgi:hypothetical protein
MNFDVTMEEQNTEFDVDFGEKMVVGGKITIDDEMSDESTNPVQNKVAKAYIDKNGIKTLSIEQFPDGYCNAWELEDGMYGIENPDGGFYVELDGNGNYLVLYGFLVIISLTDLNAKMVYSFMFDNMYYQQNIPQPTYQPAPVYQPPVVQPPVYVQPQPVYQAPQPVVQPTPYVSEYPWGYNAYIGAIANTPLQPAQTYYPVQNQPVYDMSQQGCMYETDYGRNRTVLQSSFGGRGPSIIVEHNQPQSGYATPTQPQPQPQFNSQYYQAYQYQPTDVKYTQPTQYNFQNYQYTYPSQTYSTKQTISPQLQPTIVSDRPVVPQYQPSTGIPKGISYLKEREILKNSYARTYPDGSRSFFKIPACYDDQGIWRGWNNQHGG